MKRVQTHHWMKGRVRMPDTDQTSCITESPHPLSTLPPHPPSLSRHIPELPYHHIRHHWALEQPHPRITLPPHPSFLSKLHPWITLPPDPPSLSNHITELLCHHILPHWAPTSLNYFANRSSLTEQPHHWITFPPHPPSHSHHTTSLSLRSLRCGSYKHTQNS